MKRVVLTSLLILTALSGIVLDAEAQNTYPPKREFRAAWVATVGRLDWPPNADAQTQRNQLVAQFNELKASGINVIIFQVRPEADAFYRSSIEPWSHWLTGKQGQDPGWDPLAFAIEEAHKRGMELHAWFNPYRAEQVANRYVTDSMHVTKRHPEWILHFSKINMRLLDPGKQAVRDYTARVVADVVRRYDVDGIHFDDYFYPYPNGGAGFSGITNEDQATFAAESRGFTNIARWRRDNVNLFIAQIADSIRAIKPHVKYGVSPFGIWRPAGRCNQDYSVCAPSNISGLDAYETIYADAVNWLQHRHLDYLTPQLYWRFGGGQDYATLALWWKTVMNGRHLYTGHITSTNEIPRQLRFNRANGIHGSALFRSQTIITNTSGVQDSLRRAINTRLAFPLVMPWKDMIAPNAPHGLSQSASGNTITLTWNAPGLATDGDAAKRYAVYRFARQPNLPGDLETSEGLIAILDSAQTTYADRPANSFGAPYYYVVTALDRNWNESAPSPAVMAVSADAEAVASTFLLHPNTPNPFRGSTVIAWEQGGAAEVTLSVFDTLGRKVAVLLDGEIRGAGVHQAEWDGRDSGGNAVASGTYFGVIESGSNRASLVMTVVR